MRNLYLEQVTSPYFSRYKTASSIYLLKHICDKMQIPIKIEYFYDGGIASSGYHTYDLINAVQLELVDSVSFIYRCNQPFPFQPQYDFVIDSGTLIKIVASKEGYIQTESSLSSGSGVFSVRRTESLLSHGNNPLLSRISVYTDIPEKEEQLRRVVDRLIPFRCQAVTDYLNQVHADGVGIEEEVSPFDYTPKAFLSTNTSSSEPLILELPFYQQGANHLSWRYKNCDRVEFTIQSDRVSPSSYSSDSDQGDLTVTNLITNTSPSDIYISSTALFYKNNHVVLVKNFWLKIAAYDGTVIPIIVNDSMPTVYDSLDLTL